LREGASNAGSYRGDAMANETCAHPACTCIPPKGERYCSETCKDAKDMTELRCGCNHPECVAAKL
jgi:hypothetical protein